MCAAFVGVAIWSVVHAMVSLLIFLIFAVPFGVLLAFDALAHEPVWDAGSTAVPPVPPRQPFAVPLPARAAA
jgi:hypothetical protein